MFIPTKRRLGEILKDANLITDSQLQTALERQKETNERLGKILVNLGLVNETSVIKVLESQLGIPYINLSKRPIDPETAKLIPEAMAQRYKVIPVAKSTYRLTLAMVDPLNVFAIDDVRIFTGLEVDAVIASESDVDRAISQYFGGKETLEKIMNDLPDQIDYGSEEMELDQLKELVEDAPIVKLVNTIISKGVLERASDIHVEPQENELRVRHRVDGVLFDLMTPPKRMQAPIISRIKIMANLDIAERRIPQDGRIQMRVEGKEIDLRVSTLPTIFGEKVVMRILDKSRGLVKLDELGLLTDNLQRFHNVISQPHGIILVTGPTGSGKTTTLYSVLSSLNTPEKNIITLEDPVEYTLNGVNQVQLNSKAGLTFASGLRSVLRQDPDIIMVGEIRDSETAKIAIQSAMTGHLVLSTLHTNSAAGTLARLVDMEIEPFLVSSSVVGIVAQRLVRALCPDCKVPYEPPTMLYDVMGIEVPTDTVIYKAQGCPLCNGKGYRGRLAIHEVLVPDARLRDFIIAKADADHIEQAARMSGMTTLKEDGIHKVLLGLTSLEEVMRTVHIGEQVSAS